MDVIYLLRPILESYNDSISCVGGAQRNSRQLDAIVRRLRMRDFQLHHSFFTHRARTPLY